MEQLLCHVFADYIFQSDWMALNKARKTWNCLVHCLIYTFCFLLLTSSWKALSFIFITHFIIDRFPIIVRKLIYWKNHFPYGYPSWELCVSTGYYDDSPYNPIEPSTEVLQKFGNPRHFFITIWLYIVSDNALHLLCNFIALKYLV